MIKKLKCIATVKENVFDIQNKQSKHIRIHIESLNTHWTSIFNFDVQRACKLSPYTYRKKLDNLTINNFTLTHQETGFQENHQLNLERKANTES